MKLQWKFLPIFLIGVAMLAGCNESKETVTGTDAPLSETKYDRESCTWVQTLGEGDAVIEYAASCIETEKGDLPTDHCVNKYKGEVGTGCPAKEALATCKSIMIDSIASVTGTGYIYDGGLKKLNEINADLSGKSSCEFFEDSFLN